MKVVESLQCDKKFHTVISTAHILLYLVLYRNGICINSMTILLYIIITILLSLGNIYIIRNMIFKKYAAEYLTITTRFIGILLGVRYLPKIFYTKQFFFSF